jgi:hypothetical protein
MNRKLALVITLALFVGLLNVAFEAQIKKAIADSLSTDVSPIAGPPGTPVSVFVHGATPDGEQVRLEFYFNDVSVFNTTYSQAFTYGTMFNVPDVEPGEYMIKVLDEVSNATATAIFTVTPAPPPPEAGVKAGDWIQYDYTITGWPAGTPYPKWLKVEFLSVEGTTATVRVTMNMSDGTEQNATTPVDVVAGGQALGLSGFIIPANWTTGYSINIGEAGFTSAVTIAGETTRTYAGASRTVVYASFWQYGTLFEYYWDKQTGVMVEASATSGTMTGVGKATETNMWQAQPAGLPIDPLVLYALIIAVVVIVAALAFFAIRRKKKPAVPKQEEQKEQEEQKDLTQEEKEALRDGTYVTEEES